MDSSVLADFSLGLATVLGILLALDLAIAGLLFQTVVGQGTAVQATSIEFSMRFGNAERTLSPAARGCLWESPGDAGGDRLKGALKALNNVMLGTAFHVHDFQPSVFGPEFKDASEALLALLDESLDRATSHLAMTPKDVQELAVLRVDISAAGASFERLAQAYESSLGAWRRVKRDVGWTVGEAGMMAAAVGVAAAASVHTPSVGGSDWLNLATCIVLVTGAFSFALRSGWRLIHVFSRF